MTAGRPRRPLDEVFSAVADPTRRDLLERLVHQGPRTATNLAEDHPLTRQAIVKHLRVLVQAGLVTSQREGRDVRYRATTAPLAEAVNWLLGTSEEWDRRAERLRETRPSHAARREG